MTGEVVQRNENGRRIGESHPNATISDAVVKQLRDLHEFEGWSLRRLAVRFGLGLSAVQKICAYTRRGQVMRLP
jgi:AraC-like DNA-binding protein